MNAGLFAGAGLCIAGTIGLRWLKTTLTQQRRIYWCLTCLAAIAVFVAAYPNLRLGSGLFAFMFFAMTLLAYRYTPYLRISGRTYALRADDTMADAMENPARSTDGDRRRSLEEWLATPRGMWWFIAGLWVVFDVPLVSMILRGEAISSHDRVMILAFLLFLVLCSAVLGFYDAVNQYPIAQGQRRQFMIAAICSAGLSAVLYLTVYHATIWMREGRED